MKLSVVSSQLSGDKAQLHFSSALPAGRQGRASAANPPHTNLCALCALCASVVTKHDQHDPYLDPHKRIH